MNFSSPLPILNEFETLFPTPGASPTLPFADASNLSDAGNDSDSGTPLRFDDVLRSFDQSQQSAGEQADQFGVNLSKPNQVSEESAANQSGLPSSTTQNQDAIYSVRDAIASLNRSPADSIQQPDLVEQDLVAKTLESQTSIASGFAVASIHPLARVDTSDVADSLQLTETPFSTDQSFGDADQSINQSDIFRQQFDQKVADANAGVSLHRPTVRTDAQANQVLPNLQSQSLTTQADSSYTSESGSSVSNAFTFAANQSVGSANFTALGLPSESEVSATESTLPEHTDSLTTNAIPDSQAGDSSDAVGDLTIAKLSINGIDQSQRSDQSVAGNNSTDLPNLAANTSNLVGDLNSRFTDGQAEFDNLAYANFSESSNSISSSVVEGPTELTEPTSANSSYLPLGSIEPIEIDVAQNADAVQPLPADNLSDNAAPSNKFEDSPLSLAEQDLSRQSDSQSDSNEQNQFVDPSKPNGESVTPEDQPNQTIDFQAQATTDLNQDASEFSQLESAMPSDEPTARSEANRSAPESSIPNDNSTSHLEVSSADAFSNPPTGAENAADRSGQSLPADAFAISRQPTTATANGETNVELQLNQATNLNAPSSEGDETARLLPTEPGVNPDPITADAPNLETFVEETQDETEQEPTQTILLDADQPREDLSIDDTALTALAADDSTAFQSDEFFSESDDISLFENELQTDFAGNQNPNQDRPNQQTPDTIPFRDPPPVSLPNAAATNVTDNSFSQQLQSAWSDNRVVETYGASSNHVGDVNSTSTFDVETVASLRDQVSQTLLSELRAVTRSLEGSEIVMDLNPSELGQLTLRVGIENDSVAATIVTSELATNDLLTRDKQLLVDALREQGLDISSFEVSYGGSEAQQQSADSGSSTPQQFTSPNQQPSNTSTIQRPAETSQAAGINLIA